MKMQRAVVEGAAEEEEEEEEEEKEKKGCGERFRYSLPCCNT